MKLLLLAAAAFAAAPFSPDPEAGNLRLAGASALAGVNGLLSTPVEPRHAGTLKGFLDQILAQAGSAAGGIEALGQRMEGTAASMKSATKALEPKLAAAQDRAERLPGRLADRQKSLRELVEELERKAKEKDLEPAKKAAVERRLEEAKRLLERGRGLESSVRAAAELKALEDLHWDLRNTAGRAVSDAGSLPELRRRLAGLSEGVDLAKAALDNLDVEPKNVHRTRAYQGFSSAQDAGRAVFQDCELARSRAEAFADRHRSWLKAESEFASVEKASLKRIEDVEAALSSLEKAASEPR